jgi:hypothetical protein
VDLNSPPHPASGDVSAPDEDVPSRHYKVPIAIDSVTNRLVIPSEAIPGGADRYQCYACKRFLRLYTRWKRKKDRPRERWYFQHAPHEAGLCGGESFEHAMAVAAATWVLARHLSGDTTVRCEHTCARCDTTVQQTLPRSGLHVSVTHVYEGTAYEPDVALLDAHDRPGWGLEVFQTHAVDRIKAIAIPCPWAEVLADDLRAIVVDRKRQSQREVTLKARQGRPDEAPLQKTGKWFCASCRDLPPPPDLPPGDEEAPPTGSYQSTEMTRRRITRALVRKFERASVAYPLLLQMPELCPTHQTPLILSFGERVQASRIVAPRQTTRTLGWDIELDAIVQDTQYQPPLRLGILVLGRYTHPAVHDGQILVSSPFPFLAITQQSIEAGRPVVVVNDRVSLPRWCPACREAERAAAAERERIRREEMARVSRTRTYADACKRVYEHIRYLHQTIRTLSDDDIQEYLKDWASAYHTEAYNRLIDAVRFLGDDDVVELFDRQATEHHDDVGIVPDEWCDTAAELASIIRQDFMASAITGPYLGELRKRQERVAEQQQRMRNLQSAASDLYGSRRDIEHWSPFYSDPRPTSIPDNLIQRYHRHHAAFKSACDVIIASNLKDPRTHQLEFTSPVTGFMVTKSLVNPQELISLIDVDLAPDRLLDQALSAAQRKWDVNAAANRREDLLRRLQSLERRIANGFYPTDFDSVAELHEDLGHRCAEMREEIASLQEVAATLVGYFSEDPALIQGRLDKCKPFCQVTSWFTAFPHHVQELREREADLREQRKLERHIANAFVSTPVVATRVLDHQANIHAAREAFLRLGEYLSSTDQVNAWDHLAAEFPNKARAAIRLVPQDHHPGWLKDLANVLNAPALRYAPTEQRELLLRMISSIPPAGDGDSKELDQK